MATYTTITINDKVLETLPNHPNEFIRKLTQACEGYFYKTGQHSFSLGIDVSYIKVQKPREFQETTVFVYTGGELFEVNPYSPITRELRELKETTFNDLLEIIKSTLQGFELEVISSSVQEVEKELLSSGELDFEFPAEVISSARPDNVMDSFQVDDQLIAKWLKDNKIPTTVAKLKKLKPIKK